MVVLMLLAAVVSFFLRKWLNGSAILAEMIVNAGIGYQMEMQAAVSMQALQQL